MTDMALSVISGQKGRVHVAHSNKLSVENTKSFYVLGNSLIQRELRTRECADEAGIPVWRARLPPAQYLQLSGCARGADQGNVADASFEFALSTPESTALTK